MTPAGYNIYIIHKGDKGSNFFSQQTEAITLKEEIGRSDSIKDCLFCILMFDTL